MAADRAGSRPSCTLQSTQLQNRRAAWKRLAERALRERRPTASGMQLVFAAHEGVEPELRGLARLEAQCCSFADWNVQRSGEDLLLDVTAPSDGVAAVRALFDEPSA